jgi:carotenoid 1,2-hydratase
VGPDGYAWWYLDGISDDGQHGITLIAFIGSVFSPYYAWARRRGPADPFDHCAVNVALYGPRARRWTMTERGRSALRRGRDALEIGPSALAWDGTRLTARIREVGAPFPAPVRGIVRVHAAPLVARPFAIDGAGRHLWAPIAPAARIEVSLVEPALSWSGSGYLDTNCGDEPLERTFAHWHWARAPRRGGAALLYDVTTRAGEKLGLSLAVDRNGEIEAMEPPPLAQLPCTGWRITRETRSDTGTAHVERTLTDAPFYARSLVSSRLWGETVTGVHESLSMPRFTSPIVQAMLPFRMPRRGG